VKKQHEECWCQNHLADQELPEFLRKVDEELAANALEQGCRFCGSDLHRADYPRKPRGAAVGDKRVSFCCCERDCRRRKTPASVRFLGRKVYAGFVVVLVAAMMHGLSPERVERIRQVIGADARTLKRWRQWWLENFVRSRFWKEARARFMPPLCQGTLPWALCKHFEVERRDRLLDLLKFLAPITIPNPLEDRIM
jgi:hypothetical protein